MHYAELFCKLARVKDVHRTTVSLLPLFAQVLRLRSDKPASALSPECRSLQRNSNVHGQNQDSDISSSYQLESDASFQSPELF